MPQRLSFVDAQLINAERSATPLQMGGVGLFEPGLTYATVAQVLERRLDSIRLARRRVQFPPLGAGGPVWVDDPDFDLSYHVRHAALPAPGDAGQLGQYVSRLIARPLDRNRPLWELYVIEGLAGDRVAVFHKMHLAMAGEGGGDPFGTMLDEVPEPPDGDAPHQRWEPLQQPGNLNLAVDATKERMARAFRVGRGVRSVGQRLVTDPGTVMSAAFAAAGSAANVVVRLAQQAPSSPLNGTLTPHRRFTMTSLELEDLREIRRAVGCSINDVIVAIVADAVGRLLRWRGYDTKDLDLRVMVPLKVNPDDETLDLSPARPAGEGVVGVLAPLPVMQMDSVARLYRIMGEMSQVKEARQATAAETLVRLAGYAPPNLHAMAARVAWAEQRYNVALSNAPGPQSPRYLAGKRLEASYPFIPLSGTAALSVAVSSYAGGMGVGLLGDRDAMADLDLLGEFITEALADLVVASQATAR